MKYRVALVVIVWLAMLVAGVIFVARWMRMGGRHVASVEDEPTADESTAPSGNKILRAAHRFADPVVAGAKSDLHTARNAARNVRHHDTLDVDVSETASVNSKLHERVRLRIRGQRPEDSGTMRLSSAAWGFGS